MKTMYSTITAESIRALIAEFYRYVREDHKLGPIFEKAIGTTAEDWAPHLEKINMFWCGVMLGTKGYEGNPLQAHKDLPPFDPQLFTRWLAIFANTAIETHEIAPATVFIRKSVTIADMMMRNLYGSGFKAPPMPQIPENMQHYRTTPRFMAASIPDALRKAHRTAPGVYGRIVVSKGRLLYTIGKEQCHVLDSETPGVIEPEVFHFVTPLDEAEFAVQFYKDPASLSKGTSSS